MASIIDYTAEEVGEYTDLFTLAELKEALRILDGSFDNTLAALALAGVEFVEAQTGYSLRNRTSAVMLSDIDSFRAYYPPVSEVLVGGQLDEYSSSVIIADAKVVRYKSVPSHIESLKAAAIEYVNQKFNNPDANMAKVREMCAPFRVKQVFL